MQIRLSRTVAGISRPAYPLVIALLAAILIAGISIPALSADDITPVACSVKTVGAAGDGTADDTQAIQKALSAGGTVYLPAGTYLCKTDITMAPNTTLYGDGSSSVLKFVGNRQRANIRLIVGSNSTVRDIRLSETNAEKRYGFYGLLHGVNADNVTIQHIEIDSSSSMGMQFIHCGNVKVLNCHVHNTQSDGIHFQRGSHDFLVDRCVVEDTGDDCISMISHEYGKYGNNRNGTATNNTVGKHKSSNSESSGITCAGIIGATVMNNKIRDTHASGILVSAMTEFGRTAVGGNIKISKNSIQRAGQASKSRLLRNGITISNARNVTVDSNQMSDMGGNGVAMIDAFMDITVSNNQITSPELNGVFVSPTAITKPDYLNLLKEPSLGGNPNSTAASVFAGGINITGNMIDNPGLSGIYCQGDALNKYYINGLTISGNTIIGANQRGRDGYGIYVNFAESARVENNMIQSPANQLRAKVAVPSSTNPNATVGSNQ